jgi:DNA (cytosine-5)-methyltransferase 1
VSKTELTLVDLFAGCGGLSLGMENAGFCPVFVNELNADAMATYLANRHHIVGGKPFADQEHLRCHDANELQGERLDQLVNDLTALGLKLPPKMSGDAEANAGTLDLLTGGPPCQGFSGIGHRRSYSVDKQDIPSNQLYQRMADIIERLRPRIFLFENVKGLLNSYWTRDGGRQIWPDVLERFKSIEGYEVRWSLVKSSDYGVPQNRPRVLLVGIRADVAKAASSFLELTPEIEDAVEAKFLPMPGAKPCPDLEDLLGDLVDPAVGKLFKNATYPKGKLVTPSYPNKAKPGIQRELRTSRTVDLSSKGDELTEQEYSKHSGRIVAKFRHMLENDGEIPDDVKTKKFSQRVLKKRWGNAAPNITATSLPDDYVHFSQPRTLTVREWARLQLFPDWYVFKGKRTTGGLRRAGNPREGVFDREAPKYTQIGNAVPVGLAEEVGKHFRKILEAASVVK